jgi:hypothetical protein
MPLNPAHGAYGYPKPPDLYHVFMKYLPCIADCPIVYCVVQKSRDLHPRQFFCVLAAEVFVHIRFQKLILFLGPAMLSRAFLRHDEKQRY